MLLTESTLEMSLCSCPLVSSSGASSPPAIGLRLCVVSKGHRKSITNSISHSGLPPSCSAHFTNRPSGSEGRKRAFPTMIRLRMKFSGGGHVQQHGHLKCYEALPTCSAQHTLLYGDCSSLNKWYHPIQCRHSCIV